MAPRSTASVVTATMLWTLLLVVMTTEVTLGTMLKCGEDIVVSRGERKTLKFWSAEDDLLKVQVVPAGEERLQGPLPARPVTYSRIPGLSEAILAHSRYSDKYAGRPSSQSGAGLHYAGNPDIDINSIFQSDNGTSDDGDYDVLSDEVASSTVKPVIIKQDMSDVDEIKESQVPDTPSRIADPTTLVGTTTTTSGTEASTTTTTTAQSIKLVTFFPDLQNYNPPSSTENDINKVPSSGISDNSDKKKTDVESMLTQTNILETTDSDMLSEDEIHSTTIENTAEHKYQEVPVGDSFSGENETEQETTTAADLTHSVITATKSASDGEVSSTELILEDVEGSTHTPVAASTTKLFKEEDTLSLLRDSLSEILQKINIREDSTEKLDSTAPPANEPTIMMSEETTKISDGRNEIKRPFVGGDVGSDISSTESTIESQTESMSEDGESEVLKSEIIDSFDSEISTTGEAFSTIQPMIISEINSEDDVDEDLERDVTTAIVDVTNVDGDIDNTNTFQNSRAPPLISVANIFKEAIRNQLGVHSNVENAMSAESDLETTTTEQNLVGTGTTDMLAKGSEDTEAKTATATSPSELEVDKETNGEVEETTILAQLLRDSLSQIVLDMNKGTNGKQQTENEGLSHTSEGKGTEHSVIISANDETEKISNDENIDTGEEKDLLNMNTDSIDDMEMLMNTFSDQNGEVTTEGFSEQSIDDGILDDTSSGQYVNVKKILMAGHQNIAESASTDKKEQSRIGIYIDSEDSITTEAPTVATEAGTIDVDYEATKESIPPPTSVSQLLNTTKGIEQERVQTEDLVFEDLPDSHGAIPSISNQNIKGTEADDADKSSTIWQSDSINTKEVTEQAKQSNIPDTESTTFAPNTFNDEDFNTVTTENSFNESSDGFKGYEYYETLYDSLMPQIHKSGDGVPIEDLFGRTKDGIDVNTDGPPTAPIPDFDTDMEPMEVDYEATKDSIPVATMHPSHEASDHEEQIRVQTTDLNFEEMHVSNDEKETTVIPEDRIESGNSMTSSHDITNNVVTVRPVDPFLIEQTEVTVTESDSDVSTNAIAEVMKEVREKITVRATVEGELDVTTARATNTEEVEEETTAQVTVAGPLQGETTASPPSNYRDDLLESEIDQESFQVQDYEATKDSIPSVNGNSEVAESLNDIYQMRVGNQSLNTEVRQPNEKVGADSVRGTVVSHDSSTLGKEGHESENDSMSNNILNSIASIIRHTMSASPFASENGNTKKVTSTTEAPIYTTVSGSEHEEADQKSAVDGTEGSDNGVLPVGDDSSDDVIQIPLHIVDGKVKVSHDRNSASITVPMSALETEEALDNYLNTHLQSGSHVLIKENGSKVSINSLDELTTAMELIMGNKQNATEPSNTPDADQIDSDGNHDQTDTLPAGNDVGSNSEDTLKDELQEAIDIIEEDNSPATENYEETSTDNISELENILSALEPETPAITTESTPTTASEVEPNESDLAAAIINLGQPEEAPIRDEEEKQDLLLDTVTDAPNKVKAYDIQNTENNDSSNGNPIQNTVIDILEQMLLSEASPPQNTVVGSSARQETIEEHAKESVPVQEEFSNDFNMDSLRYYSDNRDNDDELMSTSNKRASQQNERKPARKDDSGHHFGGEPPFFIKLPGSPNSVPLYIEYEPVQVRYVPVQSREGTVTLPEEEREMSSTEYSSRIGTEDEMNTIETDAVNHTVASPTRSPLVDHMEKVISQKMNASAAVVGTSEHQNVESPDSDNNEIMNRRPEITTERRVTTEGTHAHINIPLDFLTRETFYSQGPDPFVVMPPPDLASQDVKQDGLFPDYGVNDYISEGQRSKQKVTSSINVANEDENKIKEMMEVEADEPLPPGQYYSSENRGTIYGDVDLDRLNNPVFSLKAEMKRPSQEEMMNPAYTPFPITANPPKIIATTSSMPAATSTFMPVSSDENTTPFISREVITQSSTIDSPSTAEMLVGDNNGTMLKNDIFGADMMDKTMDRNSNSASYKEPQSVAYSSIPAVDFRLSFNPSDVPKFMKQNPHSFPSWYPQTTHENTFHAAALTSFDATGREAVPSMAAVQPVSEDFKSFTQGKSAPTQAPVTSKKGSARYTGNFHPNEASWQDNDDQHYGAFYHPADIPGVLLSDLTKRHLSLEDESSKLRDDELPWYKRQESSSSDRANSSVAQPTTGFRDDPAAPLLFGPKFFKYLNSLPSSLLRDFLEPSPSERAVRIKRRAALPGEQIFCEWNIKTEPGLYLLMNFQNLSAPYSVDCRGAYIEVEREKNGYDARWCGNRIAHMGTRPHVIFAKSEVRITVYDDGGSGKSQPTGFEADIDVIDLFNPSEYSEFMESNAYPHIRRLLSGR